MKLFRLSVFIIAIFAVAFSITYIPIDKLKDSGFSVLPGASKDTAYIVAGAIYKIDTANGNIYKNLSQPLNYKPIYVGDEIYVPLPFLQKYFPEYIYHSFNKVYIIDKREKIQNELKNSNFVFSAMTDNFHIAGTNIWIFKKDDKTYGLYLYPITQKDFNFLTSKLSQIKTAKIKNSNYSDFLASLSLTFANKINYSGTKNDIIINLITYDQKNGVDIKNYTFKDGKTKIVVLTIDTRKYDVVLKPTISKSGIGSWESLQEASRRINAYIVVAANYFDPSTNTPLGFLENNGNILSEPYKTRPIFAQLGSGRLKLISFNDIYSLDCLLNFNGVLFTASRINKPYKGGVTVYTDVYQKNINIPNDTIEIEAKDGKVIKKGYINNVEKDAILTLIPNKYSSYTNKIKIGDPFSFYLDTYPEIGIKSAVSAGPTLLVDGEIYRDFAEEVFSSSPIITTKAPRTAIGYDKYGDLMIIATTKPGLTIKQFQEFLKSIDVDSAMGLDGGKSTTLIIDGSVYRGFQDVKLPVFLGISLRDKSQN